MKTMKEVFNGKPCGFSARMIDEQVRHGQHAINCHDELVEMLEYLAKAHLKDGTVVQDDVLILLNKARGEK